MPSTKTEVPRVITARAACRADLAGGTVDLWPLYLFHPGAVTLNFALTIGTRCRITPAQGSEIHFKSSDTGREERFASLDELMKAKSYKHPIGAWLTRAFFGRGEVPSPHHQAQPPQGFTLETHSESPAGAGISGSSALMIATTAALARLTGRKMDREQMRELAQNVEAQIIKVPTGCQDYYPPLYGGVNAIHLREEGIQREALPVVPEEIDSRFVLVYTGAPRQSGINNWQVFKSHIDGDKKVVRNFENISQIAQAMRPALAGKQWDEVARLLREEWKLRRSNYKGISTPQIEKLMAAAMKRGGVAAKVCGAGGGGCVIIMTREGATESVEEALRANGGQVLPCNVEPNGVTVTTSR
jgi:D-glycero-alpha-D-manno-heptose-7-phosphate kinase